MRFLVFPKTSSIQNMKIRNISNKRNERTVIKQRQTEPINKNLIVDN